MTNVTKTPSALLFYYVDSWDLKSEYVEKKFPTWTAIPKKLFEGDAIAKRLKEFNQSEYNGKNIELNELIAELEGTK